MSRKNDKGKKNVAFIRKLAMQFTPEAVMTLVDLMNDENQKGSVRRACATDLLAYGWGKPKGTDEVERDATAEEIMSPELEKVLLETVKTMVNQSALMRAQGNSKAHEIIEGDFEEVKNLFPTPLDEELEKAEDGDGHGED